MRTHPGRARSTRVTLTVAAAASVASPATTTSALHPRIPTSTPPRLSHAPNESEARGAVPSAALSPAAFACYFAVRHEAERRRPPLRAAVMRGGRLVVDTVPDPAPGPGEILVRTLACGICGSDLHALRHAPKIADMARETG